jgi:hypothetical protein
VPLNAVSHVAQIGNSVAQIVCQNNCVFPMEAASALVGDLVKCSQSTKGRCG